MFKHILIPLDGSHLAEAALPVAAELCRKLGASATLVHVIEKDVPPSIHGERHLSTEEEACQYLGEQSSRHFPPGVRVQCHVHNEEVTDVARSIVEHTGELQQDLVVMCAHGNGGLRDVVVGSIAQQVIGLGRTPVLLLQKWEQHKGPHTPFEHILAGVDGNPEHQQAVEVAARLASALQASLNLLMVVYTAQTLPGSQAATGLLLPSATRALLEAEEECACQYLESLAEPWRKAGLAVATTIRRGDPAQQIVRFAPTIHADLIVLGTHGKAGMGAFWAGSVGPKVISATKTPLLLVPVHQ